MATNKFNIVLAAKFDKTQIQNTLDKMKNVKLLVAVKFDKTQIQTALNQAMGKVGTAKSGTTTGGKTASGVSAASTKASQSKGRCTESGADGRGRKKARQNATYMRTR